MRQDGFVSLWIGTARSAAALERYVRIRYDAAGEMRPSQFMTAFELSTWDEDFREADVRDETTVLAMLLANFSYDNQIIPQFEEQIGAELSTAANAAVILYNFNHSAPTKLSSKGPVSLRFVGVGTYRY